MEATGKSKTCVWRWQERFMAEGVDGLLRDKSRPPGIAPLDPELVDQIIALTLETPKQEATHWTVRAMAKAVGIAASSVSRYGTSMVLHRTAGAASNCRMTRPLPRNCTMSHSGNCERGTGGVGAGLGGAVFADGAAFDPAGKAAASDAATGVLLDPLGAAFDGTAGIRPSVPLVRRHRHR